MDPGVAAWLLDPGGDPPTLNHLIVVCIIVMPLAGCAVDPGVAAWLLDPGGNPPTLNRLILESCSRLLPLLPLLGSAPGNACTLDSVYLLYIGGVPVSYLLTYTAIHWCRGGRGKPLLQEVFMNCGKAYGTLYEYQAYI